jgi:ABC-type glycerol-3-phosphate transport system permease component
VIARDRTGYLPRANRITRQYERVGMLKPGQVVTYVALGLVLTITLFPFAWTVLDSVNTTRGIFDGQIIPDAFHWENYSRAWINGELGVYFGNSVVVALSTVTLSLIACCTAGYAFGRMRFPGATLLFYVYVFGLTVPFQAILIPIFYILKELGLLDNLLGIILTQVGTGVPFGTFLMRNFFRDLPGELADAAKIDGCSEIGVFARVMLPLARPASLALLIFSFMGSWNDFLLPLIALQTDARRTVPIGLVHFATRFSQDYSQVFAATVMSFVPVILVYLVFQRQFIEGVSVGARRG